MDKAASCSLPCQVVPKSQLFKDRHINRLIVYLHFHVKNTIINVVVKIVHSIHENVCNSDSEVANKTGCLINLIHDSYLIIDGFLIIDCHSY